MKKATVVTAGVLAVSLFGAGFIGTVAAHPQGRGDTEFGHHGGPHYSPMRIMGKHLDLTDAQRERIAEIFKEQASLRGEKMQALGEIRKELWSQAFSENFDPSQVQVLSGRQADLMVELQAARITAFNQAYQVLDAEQKQKLAQWQEKRKERVKDRSDGDRMHRGHERN